MFTNAPEDKCPNCEKAINTFVGERQPKEGDVTICAYCEAILVINKDYTVRPITEGEWNSYTNIEQMYILAMQFSTRMQRIRRESSNN